MICPFCKEKETSVIDSRPTEDGTVIRRRRECSCKQRFTTFERVQLRELIVVKKNGRKSTFDREKLAKSINIALRKRPVDSDTIEKFISKIYRNLEDLGQAEILSSTIGKYVMEGLKDLEIGRDLNLAINPFCISAVKPTAVPARVNATVCTNMPGISN